MRLCSAQALTAVVSMFSAACAIADTSPSTDALTEFRTAGSFAMQADLKSALPHLQKVSPAALDEKQGAILACMRERFVAKKEPVVPADVDAFAKTVLTDYRRYWTRVMLGRASAAAAERELVAALSKALGRQGGAGGKQDMDLLEPLLQAQLESRGYHALFGITRPLREFMLWRKQTDETYDIDLPEGREAVHVVMMDDFVSLGWLGYAVCDYHHSGGWATPDRLFAVRSAYDLESESFRVSYLAHEGQHFSDYRRFPDLTQPDLEYRAKLVELSKARSTLFDLLAAFEANGSDSREQPHPWANRQAVHQLAAKLLDGKQPSRETWQRLSVEQINAAARELLEQDSARHQERNTLH